MATDCGVNGAEVGSASGTAFPELLAALAAEFEPDELRFRNIKNEDGTFRKEFYVRSRAVMNRLDNVLGGENWEDDYVPFGANGAVKCYLTVTFPDGRKVKKSGIGAPNKKGSSNDEKAAESDAIKRAALKFGVGRYLYRDGVPWYVAERTALGGPALPLTPAAEQRILVDRPVPGTPGPAPRGPEPGPAAASGGLPRTGKAFFAWCKDREEEYDVGLLKYMNQWGKLQDCPDRMIDWDAEQVRLGFAEAERKLRALPGPARPR